MVKSRGPSTELWGTQRVTGEVQLLIENNCGWLERYDFIQERAMGGVEA